ncbi:secreted RxLR effector protein 161-like [Telopea speciosissima]|uniref:secreted RxLR effector protein 161-like n=1 Tax=Telopea speciosissima TaxID=54955 RepID=UPI001CC53A96|nr:secreted RxLR effector protein 161-like [Telopea speciosissima]
MEDSKPVSTPMVVCCKLSLNDESASVDQTKYRSMIGTLLYLTASRPDIMQSVCLVTRFQSNPKETHLLAVNRIFRYIKGIMEYGLWYPKTENFSLTTFLDADWAGSIDDRKSTSGGAFFLGKSLVAWHSKKQESVSLSTAEAEYIVAAASCTQGLWMQRQISDFGLSSDGPVTIMCDNMSAINIFKNPVQHSRTKHIDIRYHCLKEKVTSNAVRLEFVSTTDQVPDIFTKPLPKDNFERLRDKLGVVTYRPP